MKKLCALDRRSGIYRIDPAAAQAVLDSPRAKNRPLASSRVKKYASRMSKKLWKLNGEPIILSPNGELLDGEHRLRAVIESGVELETVVIFGEFAFETMGQGAVRGGRDVLSLAYGDKSIHYFALSAMAGAVMIHDRAQKRGYSPYTRQESWTDIDNSERVGWAKKNPRALEILTDAVRLQGRDKSLIAISSVAAAWFLAERITNEVDAGNFYRPVITGEGLARDDVRMALRRTLLNRLGAGIPRPKHIEALHWLAKAWQLRETRRTLFSVKNTETFPFFI